MAAGQDAAKPDARTATDGWHFPPPGRDVAHQDRRRPGEVGLDPAVVRRVDDFIAAHPYREAKAPPRWALWRHGHLVHVEGEFNKPVHVASLRKTWHALAVGAAIQQGRIPSYDQKLTSGCRR